MFAKWGEYYEGELDGYIFSWYFAEENNKSEPIFLNYTRVEELYNDTYNVSPRIILGSSFVLEE